MARRRDDFGLGARPVLPEEMDAPRAELIAEPLDYIYAEHFRQRCACRALRQWTAEQTISQELAASVASHLTHDLALHHRDEEDSLFPLLLKRGVPEDGLEPILAQLRLDHAAQESAARRLAEILSAPDADGNVKATRRSAELARTFASREQRHLAIENGIVLVLARKRLKPADIEALSSAMIARRRPTP